MEFLLNRFRNLTVLLVVVLAQLLLLAYQVKSNQDIRLIRVWSVTAVTPIAKVLEVVRRNTIGLVEDYFVLINVREENLRISKELGKLKMENHFLKSELETSERAQALNAFRARTPSRTVPARIIGTGTGANSRVVYVDQGSGTGIERGMAVVTPDGIVGKVLNAFPTASQVLLITDPTFFGAGVISQKNRVHGTIRGLGQSKCIIDHVQNEEKVDVGEMFYTSGDDRIFPKGMPVGRATVVRQGKTAKEIYVVPSGFQNGLEEVLVVVQGEHQSIPNPTETAASDNIYLMDPPPGSAPATPAQSVISTDADRLREKYKEVGDAQGHNFGEGGPGSRPPNFNLTVQQPKAATPPAAGATAQPTQGAPANQTNPTAVAPPKPRPAIPATPVADGQPVASKPKPASTSPITEAFSPGAPVPVKPKPRPATTIGPDGQPIPAPPKRVTTQNDSTINVITPAPRPTSGTIVPRTTDPGPRPAGPPRTIGPRAQQPDTSEPKKSEPAKPKPEQSEKPAIP
jgi:rod shape-determining protein MreC